MTTTLRYFGPCPSCDDNTTLFKNGKTVPHKTWHDDPKQRRWCEGGYVVATEREERSADALGALVAALALTAALWSA